jgi:hypothetical protein
LAEVRRFTLVSGRACELAPVRNVFLRHYYVMRFPVGEPTSSEASEMFALAAGAGSAMSDSFLGRPGAYTLIYSGHAARRAAGWHLHVVLLPTRLAKAWLYLVLGGKNMLQWLGVRRDSGPPRRRMTRAAS